MPSDRDRTTFRRERFYFLRHGETEWNAKRLCQGQTDVPLNATGVRQAQAAKTRLQRTSVATICCSPLSRARQTADIINEALNCPLIIIDELQEIHFGEAQGKPLFSLAYRELLRSAVVYGGESFDGFVARATHAINRALSHPGPVLIVAHGGIFHAFQSKTRLEQEGRLTNGAPILLEPIDSEDADWSMRLV